MHREGLRAWQESLVCNKAYETERTTVRLQQEDAMDEEGRRQVPDVP